MTVTPITSFAEFYGIINSDQIVFIHFWATWCRACRAIEPIYNRLSDEHGAVAKFYSVNVDKHDDISLEVRVTSLPTTIAFKDGNSLCSTVGAERGAFSAFIANLAPVN